MQPPQLAGLRNYDTDMWHRFDSSRDSGAALATPLAGEFFIGERLREIRSPYDQHLIGVTTDCTQTDVDRAVLSARSALQRGLPAWKRADVLDRVAQYLTVHKEKFALLVCDESAKPIRTARVEVDRAISTFRLSATQARSLTGDVVAMDATASGEGRIGFTVRVPVGVVGAIAPFNFPLNLVAHKVGPSIAAGCPIVLKPAGQTPMTSIALATCLIEECELPPDWIHVVPGPGAEVGNAIVDHPGIALITFTGSPEVGWEIRRRVPKKRVGLELGNNAPVIVESDSDWKSAATKIRTAGFSHAGQSCISTQRILVHRDIAEDFTRLFLEEVSSIVVGDPRFDVTEMSTLISAAETARVQSWIDEAVEQGATLLCGGKTTPEGILEPTVLSNVSPSMKVNRCEVFGPVVTIAEYTELQDAFDIANDSDFGLQAAVFTGRLDVALQAMKKLDFGGVIVNDVPTYRADQQPYGGVRDSGNTREGPAYSVREMTEIRMVILNP